MHRGPADLVIALDRIACELAGIDLTHDWSRDWLGPALQERNRLLYSLSAEAGFAQKAVLHKTPEPAQKRGRRFGNCGLGRDFK